MTRHLTRQDVRAAVARVLARTSEDDITGRLALSMLLVEIDRLETRLASQSLSDRRAILFVVRQPADAE